MSQSRIYDVIVVGAGLSGLVAAHELSLTGKDILVLEARNQIGGSILTGYSEGHPVDFGLCEIQSSDQRIRQYLRKFNLETWPRSSDGKHTLLVDNRRYLFDHTGPALTNPVIMRFRSVVNQLLKQISRWDSKHPRDIRRSHELAQKPFSAYLKRQAWFEQTRHILTVHFESILGCDLDDISLRDVVIMLRDEAEKKVTKLHWPTTQHQVKGGAFQLVRRLSQELSIELGQQVHQITQRKNTMVVSVQGYKYLSSQVIVTIPPTQAKEISYMPELSKAQMLSWQSSHAGKMFSCYLRFEGPFWRKNKRSGFALLGPSHPFQTVVDTSTPEGAYLLNVKSFGYKAEVLGNMHAAFRKEKILKTLALVFDTSVRQIQHYQEKLWMDEKGYLGFGTFNKPGTTSDPKQRIKHLGRLTWLNPGGHSSLEQELTLGLEMAELLMTAGVSRNI